jgi:hypothetical protein
MIFWVRGGVAGQYSHLGVGLSRGPSNGMTVWLASLKKRRLSVGDQVAIQL